MKADKVIKFLEDTYHIWVIVGIITLVVKIFKNTVWLYNIFRPYDEEE